MVVTRSKQIAVVVVGGGRGGQVKASTGEALLVVIR